MSKDCQVCCEPFTVMLRKPVKCLFCNYDACTLCQKRYLTGCLLDAHCMNCQRAWNDEFLDANFTKAFRTGAWKEHREKVLFERELAILPSRQPRVEATINYRAASKEMGSLTGEMAELQKQMAELQKKQFVIEKRMTRWGHVVKGKEPPAWCMDEDDTSRPTDEKSKFIMKCPDEECRGFLSTAYKCGTCQKWACPDCLVLKGMNKNDPHTCDPQLVATVSMIVKDTVPCPKCGERISKLSGCNQMWCTQCKTAFDYTTGKISTGPIHNPHFYDFVRQNGGDALQGQLQDMENDNCGAMPDYWTVNNKFPYNSLPNVYPQKYDDSYNYLMYSHRGFMDLSQVRIPALTGRFTAEDNGDLGARYLMKEISKEEMQKELIARETKRNKQLAVREVLEMVANVGIIIYRRIVADNFKNSDVVQGIVKAMAYGKELEELRKYANKSLLKIGMNKGFAVPMLNSYFEYIPARAISFWTGLSAQGDKAKYKNLW